jgi:hypothetical protein
MENQFVKKSIQYVKSTKIDHDSNLLEYCLLDNLCVSEKNEKPIGKNWDFDYILEDKKLNQKHSLRQSYAENE